MKIIKKTCTELALETDIEIPAVQRGLVWTAQQVGTLWDSIMQNMPIGSLLAYRDEEGGPLQLIDGQQRYNAIRCGVFCDKKDAFRIWVGILDNNLIFMACSESHPWGYDEKYNTYPPYLRAKYNSWLKGEQYEDDPTKKDSDVEDSDDPNFFKTASINNSYPALALRKKVIFAPLPLVMEAVENGAKLEAGKAECYEWDASSKRADGYISPSNIVSLLQVNEQDIRTAFCNICSKVRASKVRDNQVLEYYVVIHEMETDEKLDETYVSTLFSRINTQGTKLASDDERYCALCVMLGKDIKDTIASLSDGSYEHPQNTMHGGFMPPARLANWAVRLYAINNKEQFGEHNILSAASDSDFRKVVSPEAKDGFVNFCKGTDYETNITLPEIIDCIKHIYCATENDNILNNDLVPPIVYLEHYDDNWITVIALIIQQFHELFKDKRNDRWFPLLGMLPDVFCSWNECSHLFALEFWKAVQNCPAAFSNDLKNMISYGCAVAAVRENTFVHFLPQEKQMFSNIVNKEIIDNGWNWGFDAYSSRSVIPFAESKYILYYAQRKYLSRILKNIRPEKKELWGVESNKPFDIDHIIPKSLWDNEYMADTLPNKQVLFYRHNRRKNNNYIGLPSFLKVTSENHYDDWFVYESKDHYASCTIGDEQQHKDDYKEKTYKRWKYLIDKVYKELRVQEIIQTINGLASIDTSDKDIVSGVDKQLVRAINRYNFMNRIQSAHNNKLYWGCVVYRGLSRNNVLGMAEMGDSIDFSQSLVPWLSLGAKRQIAELPALYCITMGVTENQVEVGKRRGFGISLYSEALSKWVDFATANASTCAQWWNEVKTCSTDDYESQLKDYFENLLSQ